jgi:hypothetical protein
MNNGETKEMNSQEFKAYINKNYKEGNFYFFNEELAEVFSVSIRRKYASIQYVRNNHTSSVIIYRKDVAK